MSENITISEITQLLENEFCASLGPEAQFLCDAIVSQLVGIIPLITNPNSVSIICVDHLKLCARPFDHPSDMEPVPRYTLDLDLAPMYVLSLPFSFCSLSSFQSTFTQVVIPFPTASNRWTEICSQPIVKKNGQYLYNFITALLPSHGQYINDLGELINNMYFPAQYRDEIQGCAQAMGIP